MYRIFQIRSIAAQVQVADWVDASFCAMDRLCAVGGEDVNSKKSTFCDNLWAVWENGLR
jgi:hypothetical protein